ncbi:MAG: hypothetical protein IPN71_13125 [Fibrobacteres bacterium]|nr:hypothetical protein [Fibrobacterota bacterium]
MAFSSIVEIITNSEDVIYFLTSPYTMGRIDSSRIGIWETSRLGARVKKIYPNANTVVGPCSRAVPKQLAIGPFGNILFYAVDRMDPYTTNPFICSLDPKSGLTSIVGYVPKESYDADDMIYVKTRGLVLSYGNNNMKQLTLEGNYSEIPNLDHKKMIYSLATSNAGNLCVSSLKML